MSQQPDEDFDIDPYTTSGIQLTTYLNNLNDALLSMRSGDSTPPSAVAGTVWLKTTDSANHICYYYDGTIDIKMFTVVTASNTIVFEDNYITFKDSSLAISEDGSALANDDGTDNTNIAIGPNAGASITSGFDNILLGDNAGNALTTASGTVAIGKSALPLSVGSGNIAIGKGAGEYSTYGSANIMIGNEAGAIIEGGGANYCIGHYAGRAITSGGYNVALGYNSLRSGYSNDVTGDRNFASGYETMSALTSGDDNIAIGKYASLRLTTGSNNVAIGLEAGHYSNSAKTTYITTYSDTVCIGRDSYATTSYQIVMGSNLVHTSAKVAVAWTTLSDERKKTFQEMDLGLDFINAIEPKKFTWNSGNDQESINYGFSAQQVKATLKEQVGNKKRYMHQIESDEFGMQNLAYTEFVAPLVKAVQELSDINKDLLARIEVLENK